MILESLQKILEIQRQIQDIHPFLEKVFPIAIADENRFLIFDQDGTTDHYHFVQEAPTPMPIPLGVRAAFPLDNYGGRMACVVTAEVFDTLDGYVTIFHEFVHCQQFETYEPGLKNSLEVARNAQAAGDFMWEINHPFPYDDAGFVHIYAQFLRLEIESDPAAVRIARKALKNLLDPEDYEYMTWQEWKEGFARWIENQVQKRLGLPENHGGRQQPFSRVTFYAGGAGYIRFLESQGPGLALDPERLFQRMLEG